jgi:hypothetical protein
MQDLYFGLQGLVGLKGLGFIVWDLRFAVKV